MNSGPLSAGGGRAPCGAAVLALRRALSTGALLRGPGDDLAYSMVATVPSQMLDTGVLTRTKQGRSYAYAPAEGAPGTTARRMHQAQEPGPNREAVLARFVGNLPATDEELLRQLLGNVPKERRRGGDRDAHQRRGPQVRAQDRHGSPRRELKQHPGERL
ncbi:BlaI/MecI/CopY family transcriptional regulator [Streptomyces sp. NPDC002513]